MTHDTHLLPDEIAGLCMLEESDPERQRAQAHVATCEHCRSEWLRAEATLRLLDEAFVVDTAPPRDLIARGVAIETAARSAEASGSIARLAGWLLAALASLGALGLAWVGIGETLRTQPFLKCAGIELTTGAIGLGAAYLLTRRAQRGLSPSLGAAAASGGALLGEAYLHLACTDHGLTHLVWAHGATVAAAAVLGAWVARALPALRARA